MSDSLAPQVHDASSTETPALDAMPITQHLMVLRKHLFKIVGALIAIFFCLLPFANKTYIALSEPLKHKEMEEPRQNSSHPLKSRMPPSA
jgi:sec-independent protein translocase protein TatC